MDNLLKVKIKDRALYLLSRRDYSEKELILKISQRRKKIIADVMSHPNSGTFDCLEREFENMTEEVVKEMQELGYQDEQRFVESYIRLRISRGKGPEVIKQELLLKKVKSEIVEDGIDSFEDIWIEKAEEVRVKKFSNVIPKDFQKKMKQKQFLRYRGFPQEVIQKLF